MDTSKRTVRRRRAEKTDDATTPTESVDASVSTIKVPETHSEHPARKTLAKPKQPKTRLELGELENIVKQDDFDMAAFLGEGTGKHAKLQQGDKISGVIVRISGDTLWVDIGGKHEATAATAEWPNAQVGQDIGGIVTEVRIDEVRISKNLTGPLASAFLEEACEDGLPVEGTVRSLNAGGFEVMIGKARAFCPKSQIHRLPGTDLEQWVGQTLTFKVLETGDKTVLSRRALQEEQIEGQAQAFWQAAQPGQNVQGVVTSVHAWGAFVDVNGIDGTLHKRDIAWGGDADPLSMFIRGQTIGAQILKLEPEKTRVVLSLKSSADDPWQMVGTQFSLGSTHQGNVTRVESYGVFVQLVAGVTGLVHMSAFKTQGASMPPVGATQEVVIRGIDLERRRLDFGVPGSDASAERTQMTGQVKEVMKNGVVVQFEDGTVGWLPATEVELPAGTVLSQRFRRGRTVTAQLLEVQGSRLLLTMKAATDSSWTKSDAEAGVGSFGTLGDLLKGFKP